MDMLEAFYHYLNSNVILVGYRGYGHSTCSPSESGLEIDAKSIVEYALNNPEIDPHNIYLLGASMEGATSIYTSKIYQNSLKGLILCNTFTSLPEVIDDMNFIFRLFRPLILNNYWPNKDRIGKLTLPIMFISGRSDEMIPYRMMDKLFELAEKSKYKTMHKVQKGTHNGTWFVDFNTLFDAILEFMEECDKISKSKTSNEASTA